MKTRTKITVTLAVGLGILAGSVGVASASPHYTDWSGKVVEEPAQAERDTLNYKLKDVIVTSIQQNLGTNVWTNGNATSLEHGPGLHDSVHCLHNNGAFEAGNRVNNYFSRGLHNNGAFLPRHRG